MKRYEPALLSQKVSFGIPFRALKLWLEYPDRRKGYLVVRSALVLSPFRGTDNVSGPLRGDYSGR
jgi:hypothetical protein